MLAILPCQSLEKMMTSGHSDILGQWSVLIHMSQQNGRTDWKQLSSPHPLQQ